MEASDLFVQALQMMLILVKMRSIAWQVLPEASRIFFPKSKPSPQILLLNTQGSPPTSHLLPSLLSSFLPSPFLPLHPPLSLSLYCPFPPLPSLFRMNSLNTGVEVLCIGWRHTSQPPALSCWLSSLHIKPVLPLTPKRVLPKHRIPASHCSEATQHSITA